MVGKLSGLENGRLPRFGDAFRFGRTLTCQGPGEAVLSSGPPAFDP